MDFMKEIPNINVLTIIAVVISWYLTHLISNVSEYFEALKDESEERARALRLVTNEKHGIDS